MPDLFWMIGLALANEQAMLPIAITYGFIEGFYRKQWKMMVWFIFLLIITVFVGHALKSVFKIPRVSNPNTYGFPSGHTQFAIVFYGWLCYQLTLAVPRYLGIVYAALTITILAYAVTAIVHYGYHTWFDIMGGIASGGLLLFLGTKAGRVLTLSKPKVP